MKILIDGQTFHTHERNRGIGRYLISVLKHMVAISPQPFFCISTIRDIDLSDLDEIKNRIELREIKIDINSDAGLQALQYRQGLEDLVSQEHIDIYWNPNPLMTNVIFPGKLKGCKSVATIHDLIPLIFPCQYLDTLRASDFEEYFSRLTKLSMFNRILAVSNATGNDLIRFTSVDLEKMDVIYEGVEKIFSDKPTDFDKDEVRLRYGLPHEFIFTMSGPNFRKNNEKLIEAFALLVNKYCKDIFLVIGSEFNKGSKEGLKSLAKDRGVADRLIFAGAIPDGDLPVIYYLSTIFVFPSLYEGFGLPLLEAMAAGIPVVASNNSSITEVAGDAGLYFDPYDTEDMADKIIKPLADNGLYQALSNAAIERAGKFSWEDAAERIISLFELLLKEQQGRKTPRIDTLKGRMRLAYFSPLNPQHSGISDYSEALLMHLKEYADIDLFTDGIIPSNPEIVKNFAYYDYKEFEKMADRYDNVIYHMGNNTLHHYIYSTLQRFPGIVVLHDYNIHPFVREITFAAGNPEAYKREMEECYGILGKFINERMEKNGFSINIHGFPLNGKIMKQSKAVIVHSEWARDQLSADDVFVVPHGACTEPEMTPEEFTEYREEKGIPQNSFVIGCFGDIVHTKRIDVIIKAFSIFRLFFEDAKLFLIGKCYKEMEDKISTLIRRYNLEGSVIITGKVSLDDFKRYMMVSDVILNLRYPTMGEASGSLQKAFSFGKAVIVSNVNQFRELPDDCCLKVNVGEREQDALLSCLIQLKRDPYFRQVLGDNARKYVKNSSWEEVAKKYMEVLFMMAQDTSEDKTERDATSFALNIPLIGSARLEGSLHDQSVVQPIIQTGSYEPHVIAQFKKLLKPGSVFLDIGANIGVMSVVASYIVSPTGLIIAVEAGKNNFGYLERNLERIGFGNYKLFNYAAWDCETTMNFSFVPNVAGCSFFSTTGVQEGKVEVVSCKTVDTILSGIGNPKIDVVKIDVEGAELKALKGMANTLDRCKPSIIFELNNGTLKRFFDISPKEIWDFFAIRRYSIYDLGESGDLVEIASSEQFCNLTSGGKGWAELLARPQ